MLSTLIQDLQYCVRTLFRNPGSFLVLMISLALGIGVNTAAITAYKAIFTRPLDARNPRTMVDFALRLQNGAVKNDFSYPDYVAYRNHLHSFSGIIAVTVDELRLTDTTGIVAPRKAASGSLMGRIGLLGSQASKAETVSAFLVSEDYFSVLGVPALRGRTFDAMNPADLAASPPVLISENYYQKRFGGDPTVLGKSIRLNDVTFTIVGITPHDFAGTSIAVPNFWLPLSLDTLIHPAKNRLHDRDDLCCRIFGRLAPGVDVRRAQGDATALASHLRILHDARSDLSKQVSVLISPGSPFPGHMNANLKLTVSLVMLAVGMVLVIACANAAGLQLARATTRQHELGIRLSLGASRSRLIRQLLTESALIGVIAGCIALPVTWTVLHVAVTKAAEALPVEYELILNVNPDLQIFAYVFVISLVAGLLFGLAPAIETSGGALFSMTRDTTLSFGRSRSRNLLIVAQVAVSLVLLIAGSMLVRSAIQTLNMNTGYDACHVIELSPQFPEASKYTADRKAFEVRDLRARLAALPGVASITNARAPDDTGGRQAAVSLNGEPPSAPNMYPVLYYTWTEANYFQTLGIPLSLGHGFPSQPIAKDRSAILSESAARRLWPGQTPIGRTLRLATDEQFHEKGELLPDGSIWRVIGVARDARGVTLDRRDSEQVYLPLPSDRLQDYPILIRTHSDPTLVMRAMDPVISAVDPSLIASASTLEDMLRRTDAFLADSTSAAIACTIGLFGLLLASVGIYSNVSYMVALRTPEVGIRMAIGAQKRDILALMLREGIRPVALGLLIGIALSAMSSRLLRGVLYGIGTVDSISFFGATFLFLSLALVATWLPSRRAMRVDPMTALRYE